MLVRKFGRKKAHRTHMLRNLASSLILYEKVETTEAKAREVKRLVEKSITQAKKTDLLSARRQLQAIYFDTNVAQKLLEVLRQRYADRPSGYSQILRLGNRKGDGALKAVISLLPESKKATEKTVKESSDAKAK